MMFKEKLKGYAFLHQLGQWKNVVKFPDVSLSLSLVVSSGFYFPASLSVERKNISLFHLVVDLEILQSDGDNAPEV